MFVFSPWFQLTDHCSKPSRLIDNHADCKLVHVGSTAIAMVIISRYIKTRSKLHQVLFCSVWLFCYGDAAGYL